MDDKTIERIDKARTETINGILAMLRHLSTLAVGSIAIVAIVPRLSERSDATWILALAGALFFVSLTLSLPMQILFSLEHGRVQGLIPSSLPTAKVFLLAVIVLLFAGGALCLFGVVLRVAIAP